MFKQLSQFGKNITDELSRGINEDPGLESPQGSGGQSGKREEGGTAYEELPKDIQAKLRKFEKYEQKYPLLLNAYKAEKEKADEVNALLKVLSENTPVSGTGDVETLRGFFEDVGVKTAMLTEEIKRITGEKNGLQKQLAELQESLEQNQRDLALKDEELAERSRKATEQLELCQQAVAEKDAAIVERDNAQKSADEAEMRCSDAETHADQMKSQIESMETELKRTEKLLTSYKATIKQLGTSQATGDAQPLSEATSGKGGKKGRAKRGKGKKQVQATDDKADTSIEIKSSEEKALSASSAGDDIIDAIETKLKYENLVEEYQQLSLKLEESRHWEKECLDSKKKVETLETEIREIKAKLKNSNEELETVRGMLKTVGNELVQARDELKQQNSEGSNEVEKLKSQLQELQTEKSTQVTTMKEELQLLNNQKQALEANVEQYKRKIEDLEAELLKSQESVSKFRNQNNELSEKLRDYTILKKSEATAKASLSQKEKTIEYLEQQVKQYNAKEIDDKKALGEANAEAERWQKAATSLEKELERIRLEAKKHDDSLEGYIKENGKLSERLEVLQEKYDSLQNLKSNSSDQVSAIRKQCEELNSKLKEATKRIMSLEDELNETSTVLQERTREANTMRRMLNSDRSSKDTKLRELEDKVIAISEERDKLKSELEVLISRKNHESQELKNTNQELVVKIHSLELKEQELATEVQQLKVLNQTIRRHSSTAAEGSEELEMIVRKLKESLRASEKKLRELKDYNDELKSLNAELNAKLDRLSNRYKVLSSQLKMSKDLTSSQSRHSSRSGSLVSPSPDNETGNSPRKISVSSTHPAPAIASYDNSAEMETNEKVAYIRNVLLGFLEHREQRSQLLPVVSTLLQLSSHDEKRLLTSLK
ncbi:AaceriADL037Wp [[Ashbya] aceris (nom. inval.)]|nr:AaceriADL037Wp [[Ashbya] aceris (nom. inval.)]